MVDGNSWINRGISLEAEAIQTSPTSLDRRSWNGPLSPAQRASPRSFFSQLGVLDALDLRFDLIDSIFGNS